MEFNQKKILLKHVYLASLADETPEGKSIIELAETKGFLKPIIEKEVAHFVKFTAETRSSGIDMNGMHIRKGAFDAIKNCVEHAGNKISPFIINKTKEIASNGGTPLVLVIMMKQLVLLNYKTSLNREYRNVFSVCAKWV